MRFFGQSFVQEMCARNVLRIEQNFFVHFAKNTTLKKNIPEMDSDKKKKKKMGKKVFPFPKLDMHFVRYHSQQ